MVRSRWWSSVGWTKSMRHRGASRPSPAQDRSILVGSGLEVFFVTTVPFTVLL